MELTINELLVLQKTIRGRIGQLQSLQTACSKRETYFGREDKVVEPQYDVKELDKKIIELQNFLYLSDARIKQSNALTKVNITCDVDSLLSPIQ